MGGGKQGGKEEREEEEMEETKCLLAKFCYIKPEGNSLMLCIRI